MNAKLGLCLSETFIWKPFNLLWQWQYLCKIRPQTMSQVVLLSSSIISVESFYLLGLAWGVMVWRGVCHGCGFDSLPVCQTICKCTSASSTSLVRAVCCSGLRAARVTQPFSYGVSYPPVCRTTVELWEFGISFHGMQICLQTHIRLQMDFLNWSKLHLEK